MNSKTQRSPPSGNIQRSLSLSETMNSNNGTSVNSESACAPNNRILADNPPDCKYPCGICNFDVDGALCASVQCGGPCGKWMHATCCGLPKKLPNCLIDNQRVFFFCVSCTPTFVTHAPAQEAAVTHESVQLSNRFALLEEKVFAQDNKLDLILDSLVPNEPAVEQAQTYATVTSRGGAVARNTKVQAKDIALTAVQLYNDEERRQRSVVIEKLNETDGPHQDAWQVDNIFKELGINPGAIEEVHRMPRFRAPQRNRNDHSRPVKVVLRDSFSQRQILARARDLRFSEHYHRTFLRRSMSNEERQLLRDMNFRCFMINSETNPTFNRRDARADNQVECWNVRNEKLVHYIRRSPAVDFAVDRGWRDTADWRKLVTNRRNDPRANRGRAPPQTEEQENE